MTAVTPSARSGSRLGAWALSCAILSAVWFWGALWLAFVSFDGAGPQGVGVIASILVGLGWFLVPTSFIVALILGIVAIFRNSRRGVILGIVALVVLLIAIMALVVFVAAAFGAFG